MQNESLNLCVEKSMVCFILTFTVFHVVLLARSAVLLYSLCPNLHFLVSSGKRKMVLPCQTLSLCQQTVNLACHEDLTNCFTRISHLLNDHNFLVCVTLLHSRSSLVCCILILKSIKYFTYGQLKFNFALF